MKPAIKEQTTVNGVNVDELFGTIDAVKKTPVIAKFKFHANNQWKGGGHNRTFIQNFYGNRTAYTPSGAKRRQPISINDRIEAGFFSVEDIRSIKTLSFMAKPY